MRLTWYCQKPPTSNQNHILGHRPSAIPETLAVRQTDTTQRQQ
jgi:hypothetical protein